MHVISYIKIHLIPRLQEYINYVSCDLKNNLNPTDLTFDFKKTELKHLIRTNERAGKVSYVKW
jgi:hypothetical protein